MSSLGREGRDWVTARSFRNGDWDGGAGQVRHSMLGCRMVTGYELPASVFLHHLARGSVEIFKVL